MGAKVMGEVSGQAGISKQIAMYSATQDEYPFVVAHGQECVSSRGDILVFLKLGNAIACQQEMNRLEALNGFVVKARWNVKRLPVDRVTASKVFFEELLSDDQLAEGRDVSRRGWSQSWRI
jgi:hypothetical protein